MTAGHLNTGAESTPETSSILIAHKMWNVQNSSAIYLSLCDMGSYISLHFAPLSNCLIKVLDLYEFVYLKPEPQLPVSLLKVIYDFKMSRRINVIKYSWMRPVTREDFITDTIISRFEKWDK